MTNNIVTKLALISAMLVSTLSVASAQGFSGSHDNDRMFNSQQQPTDQNKSDVGENGGA